MRPRGGRRGKSAGQDRAGPGLREQGREAEAERIEAGAGFSLVAGEGGRLEIISGGRRETL